MEQKQQLAPLRRGMELLRAVAQAHDWCTFSGLQEALNGLPAPTLSRLLKVLVDEKLVEKDALHGRYRKGSALLDLAHLVLGSLPKARVVQPVLDWLADETGQSAAFFTFDTDAIVMVAKAERPNSCHFIDVGARNTDLARHGFARVILAYMPPDVSRSLLEQAPHRSELGMADLQAHLMHIRSGGLCVERSESKTNWLRVTAPVFNARTDGLPDAIGVTAVNGVAGAGLEDLQGAVRGAAQRATDELGRYFAKRIEGDRDVVSHREA